jgi:hypothetical protein
MNLIAERVREVGGRVSRRDQLNGKFTRISVSLPRDQQARQRDGGRVMAECNGSQPS